MNIKNYNSTLSLSNYNLGGAYTFYVHNINLDRLTNANEEMITKYSPVLTEIVNDDSYTNNNGQYLNFTRVIGIVVDKHEANDERDIDKITVMFRTDDDRYILNKYVVNSKDIFTNNKDNISLSRCAPHSVREIIKNNSFRRKEFLLWPTGSTMLAITQLEISNLFPRVIIG